MSYWNTQRHNKTKIYDQYVNIRQVLAKYASETLCGQGITIQTEDEELKKTLEKIAKNNLFSDLLINATQYASLYGRVIFKLIKQKDDNIIIELATPEIYQNVSMIDITPIRAKIMQRYVIGELVYIVNEEWDTQFVRRTLNITDKNNLPTSVQASDIPKQFNFPKEERHGLGFVPFVQWTNRPGRQILPMGYITLSDWYNAQQMEDAINNSLKQFNKEKILGKTRAFGKLTTIGEKDLSLNGDSNILMDDLLVETELGQGSGVPVATLPSSYDGLKWLEPAKEEINMYFNFAGYSDIFPKGVQQTEAETLDSKDLTTKTNKTKRRRLTEALNLLFSQIIVILGKASSLEEAEEKFTIEIKETTIYNKLQLSSFLIEMINGRLMSRVEAIMIQRDIDNKTEAEEILKAIDKEMEDDLQIQQIQMEAQGQANGMGEYGNGGDTDKVSQTRSKPLIQGGNNDK